MTRVLATRNYRVSWVLGWLNINRILALVIFRLFEGGSEPIRRWRQEAEDPKGAFEALGTYVVIGATIISPIAPWPYFVFLRRFVPWPGVDRWIGYMAIGLVPTCGLVGFLYCRMRSSGEDEAIILSEIQKPIPPNLDLFGRPTLLLGSSVTGIVLSSLGSLAAVQLI